MKYKIVEIKDKMLYKVIEIATGKTIDWTIDINNIDFLRRKYKEFGVKKGISIQEGLSKKQLEQIEKDQRQDPNDVIFGKNGW